jgi:4-hydroxy-tetrahydrodipicolinate synthase
MQPSTPDGGHDARLRGVCPVLAVPFTNAGDVDLDSFGALVDHVWDTGVSAATLFGLASEFPKLTEPERDALQAAFLDRSRPRTEACAIVSVTDHSAEVAARASAAEAAGADAVNVLPPHFLNPSAQAVVDHLEQVLAAVAVPVMVQYAPAQTGTSLDVDALVELRRRHGNLGYVKVETQPPGPFATRLLDRSAGGLRPLIGYAGMHLPDGVRRGITGVQPGCSLTEVYVEIWRRFESGDEAAAEELHRRLLPFIATWMGHIELIVAAEKLVLADRGIIASPYCRAPGYELDAVERADVRRAVSAFADLLRDSTFGEVPARAPRTWSPPARP